MESTSRATAAGAFVVIMMAMLIGVLFWFSIDKKTDQIEYDIFTTGSSHGLLPRANVELHGINVGTVQSVSFAEGQPGLIQIRMMIDRNAPITQATYAMLNSRGVTGVAFVDLLTDVDAPKEKQTQLLSLATKSGVPEIPLKPTPLQAFAEDMGGVLKQVDQALAQLNQWLSEENSQKLFTAVENAGNAAGQVAKLGHTLDVKANEVFTDVSVALKDVSALVQNTNQMIQSLNGPKGSVSGINKSMESLAVTIEHLNRVTLPQIDRAARSFDKAMDSASQLMDDLDDDPQSLLMGASKVKPGPGEAGFSAPK